MNRRLLKVFVARYWPYNLIRKFPYSRMWLVVLTAEHQPVDRCPSTVARRPLLQRLVNLALHQQSVHVHAPSLLETTKDLIRQITTQVKLAMEPVSRRLFILDGPIHILVQFVELGPFHQE